MIVKVLSKKVKIPTWRAMLTSNEKAEKKRITSVHFALLEMRLRHEYESQVYSDLITIWVLVST